LHVVGVVAVLDVFLDEVVATGSVRAVVKAGVRLNLIGVVAFLHILVDEVVPATGDDAVV
tara:strand:+ start:622 stop:801 length:180 start_codon:yes stop_codon:yes gene_type:complete